MEKRLWRDSFRFSLSLQMIVMVLVLALAGMVLVRTWAGVISTVRRTEALNKGVLLCRSAAELYTREGDLPETVRTLGGSAEAEEAQVTLTYDRALQLTDEEGFLTLELREQQPEAEGLHCCVLRVSQEGRELYTLTVKTFVPEGG